MQCIKEFCNTFMGKYCGVQEYFGGEYGDSPTLSPEY